RQLDFLAGARMVRCATPQGLILLKLYALPSLYRHGQIARAKIYEGDIGSLLAAFPETDTEKLLGVLSEHDVSNSDVSELRNILAEQQPRTRRFL
ncbi:MAG: hypothetical protein ABJB09_04770, partial [Verrucomicrobiota bacterium]